MALITKIENKAGKFDIKFSIRGEGKFVISVPKNVCEKLGIKYGYKKEIYVDTWKDVNKKLKEIEALYLSEVDYAGKIITIQIATSESKYINPDSTGDDSFRDKYDEDYLDRGSGFIITWAVFEKYDFKNSLKDYSLYKMIDTNGYDGYIKDGRMNLVEQLLFMGRGEIRKYEYREDLHLFLKKLDEEIAKMLQQLINYFDKDDKKFIQNFEELKFKLLK